MLRRTMVSAIGVLLLVFYLIPVPQAQTKQTGANIGQAQAEGVTGGRPVMWEAPVDLESRDLFYGIGGKQGEPDPSARFQIHRT